jgi:hypothetical protein
MIVAGHMSHNAYLKDNSVCRSMTFKCIYEGLFDYGIVKTGFCVFEGTI